MSNPEASILERIKAVRAPQTLQEAPDETLDAIVPDETAEAVKDEVVEPVELDESEVNQESAADDAEEFYVNINDREISFKQIHEWEQGSLRQSDYTKKTQNLADDRREFETKQSKLDETQKSLDDSIASLSVLIDENKEAVDWDELRDYDPGEYLKQKELQDKRKQALKDAKGVKSGLSNADKDANIRREQDAVLVNNPLWMKDGELTSAYKKDMSTVNDYLISHQYTKDEQEGIVSAKHWQAVINAAKYEASIKSNASISKKVRQAPIVTKPGGASKGTNATELDAAISRHKKLGTPHSALALRKAQNKFKGK